MAIGLDCKDNLVYAAKITYGRIKTNLCRHLKLCFSVG